LVSLSGFALERIHRIPPEAIDIFASVTSRGLPTGFELAAMGAFWWKEIIPSELVRFWQLLYVGVFFLVFNGLWAGSGTRWSRVEVAALGAIGFVLALGPASTPTRIVFEFLWTYMPGFQGFRESHKFVVLMVLSYAYLGALGIASISRLTPFFSLHTTSPLSVVKWALLRHFIPLFALALPISYGIGLIGFSGEVRPTEYPMEWHEARDVLRHDREDDNVLVLPWHSFMELDWLDQRQNKVANPARMFFGRSIIQADNQELSHYYSDSNDPVSRYVEAILDNRDSITEAGALLVPLNVSHILLLKEEDFETYAFLSLQSDLRVVIENSRLVLFENIHETGSVLGLSLSERGFGLGQDITFERLLNLDATVVSKPVKVEKNSLIKVAYSTAQYEFVALPLTQGIYREGWTNNGKPPLGYYLGFMPTFPVVEGQGILRYHPFWQRVVWGYAVSLVTLMVVAGVIGKKRILRGEPLGPSTSVENIPLVAR